MRFFKYIPFLFLIYLFSCTSNSEAIHADKVLVLKSTDFKDWASLIHVEEVTPLGENEDSLLSIAQKCLIGNERILFWDFKMRCVYTYNTKGEYLFTLGRQGGAEFEARICATSTWMTTKLNCLTQQVSLFSMPKTDISSRKRN